MRIRHLDPPNGYYAAFSIPQQPFAIVEPLLYFGLVERGKDLNEPDRGDEVVGFVVIDDVVVAADMVDGFVQYWRPKTANVDEEYKALFQQLYQQGYDAFIEANPHLAPQPSAPAVTAKRTLKPRT